ncbi:cyclic nucleotide-binding domain-containing protein [Candidatus Gracilibacteria bacterium]|nr:cyclic nucleotide-binding domain-containing protein [Candidatus Gracilibacteria bacterium]
MAESIYGLTIFQGINHEVVDDIISHCKEKNYKQGQTILQQGDPSNGEGYILKSGRVSILIGENRIAELSEGDIFGEMALLSEEERSATVIAETDIIVIMIRIEDLINMINNDSNKINKEIIRRIEENLER